MYWVLSGSVDIFALIVILSGIMNCKINKNRVKVFAGIYVLITILLGLNESVVPAAMRAGVPFLLVVTYIFALYWEYHKDCVVAISFHLFFSTMMLTLMRCFTKNIMDAMAIIDTKEINISICLLICLIYVAIALIVKKKGLALSFEGVRRRNIFVIAMALVTATLYATGLQIVLDAESIESDFKYRMLFIIMFGLFLIFILLTAFLVVDSIRERGRIENQIAKDIIDEQIKYHQLVMDKEMETRRIKHDMKNHLAVIESLVEQGDFEEVHVYLDKLISSVSNLDMPYNTGNDILNTIISRLVKENQEVEFECCGMIPESVHIDNYDVCTIFYNLFNNAFEYEKKHNGRKYIAMEIKVSTNDLVFVIKNIVSDKIKIVNGMIKSEKRDGLYHGFGIKNARRTVESLGGKLLLECKDGWFESTVILYGVIDKK